jgi:hypothetical protein
VLKILPGDAVTYLVEKLDLTALASDHVGSFLFALAPLSIAGGTGSPINPVAVA